MVLELWNGECLQSLDVCCFFCFCFVLFCFLTKAILKKKKFKKAKCLSEEALQ